MDEHGWYLANKEDVEPWLSNPHQGYVLTRAEQIAEVDERAAYQFVRRAFELMNGPGRPAQHEPLAFGQGDVEAAWDSYRQDPSKKAAERYARLRLRQVIPAEFYE